MSTPSPAVSKVQQVWTKAPNPPEYINSVAVSGDGSVVAAGTFCHAYSSDPKVPSACSEDGTFGTYFWNAQGQPLWAPDTYQGWQGVYWVAVSRDGSQIASTGWATKKPNFAGFINAYDTTTKTRTLAYAIPERGNMAALSGNGTTLVAVADKIYVFTWSGTVWQGPAIVPVAQGGSVGPAGERSGQRLLGVLEDAAAASRSDYVVSVGISNDGTLIVASTAQSKIILISNNNGKLTTLGTVQIPNATVHNVAMAGNGAAFGVAATLTNKTLNTNQGYLYYFATAGFNSQSTPQWQYYLQATKNCRAVTISDDGTLVCGAGSLTLPNESYLGAAVLVKSAGSSATQLFNRYTMRDPNGVSMDSLGQYVTVADGYPDATPTQPSPGHFYLFDDQGLPLWSVETNNMNWPCPISADGSAIVGGSDNGSVYYFSHAPGK